MMDRLYLLRCGLPVVPMFVGLTIAWLNGLYGGKFLITISRGFLAAVIARSVVPSLRVPRHRPAAKTSAVPGARGV